MLYWLNFFLFLFFLGFFNLFWLNYSLLVLLLHSELLIILLFIAYLASAIFSNISFLVGTSFCYLIFGGMELSLSLLLLVF